MLSLKSVLSIREDGLMREQEEGCILFSSGLGPSGPSVWLLAALWHVLFLAREEGCTNGTIEDCVNQPRVAG